MSAEFDAGKTLLRSLNALLKKARFSTLEPKLPSIVVLGRRGSGKTTLLNEILGQKVGAASAVHPGQTDTKWRRGVLRNAALTIDVLDTRGFQTANSNNGTDSDHVSITLEALREREPDIFLFLIKAKEVNAAITTDLDIVESLLRETLKCHNKFPLLVVVITQCDELDPPYINLALDREQHLQEWEEKLGNVQLAVQVIQRHLELRKELHSNVVDIVPTAAFVCRRADGTIDPDPRLDHRWNISA